MAECCAALLERHARCVLGGRPACVHFLHRGAIALLAPTADVPRRDTTRTDTTLSVPVTLPCALRHRSACAGITGFPAKFAPTTSGAPYHSQLRSELLAPVCVDEEDVLLLEGGCVGRGVLAHFRDLGTRLLLQTPPAHQSTCLLASHAGPACVLGGEEHVAALAHGEERQGWPPTHASSLSSDVSHILWG